MSAISVFCYSRSRLKTFSEGPVLGMRSRQPGTSKAVNLCKGHGCRCDGAKSNFCCDLRQNLPGQIRETLPYSVSRTVSGSQAKHAAGLHVLMTPSLL